MPLRSKVSALIGAVQGSVVLDQGWDVLSFAQQLHGLSSGSIGFVTIPVQSLSLQTPSDGDAVKVDPAQVREFVQTAITTPAVSASAAPHHNGVRPVAATSSNTPTTQPKPPPVSIPGCVN